MQNESEETKNVRAGLRADVNTIMASMANLLTAIVGNPLTQDGGLSNRMTILEKEVLLLKNRIIENELKDSERKIYVAIMWAVGSTVLMVSLGALVAHYIK